MTHLLWNTPHDGTFLNQHDETVQKILVSWITAELTMNFWIFEAFPLILLKSFKIQGSGQNSKLKFWYFCSRGNLWCAIHGCWPTSTPSISHLKTLTQKNVFHTVNGVFLMGTHLTMVFFWISILRRLKWGAAHSCASKIESDRWKPIFPQFWVGSKALLGGFFNASDLSQICTKFNKILENMIDWSLVWTVKVIWHVKNSFHFSCYNVIFSGS